MATNVAAAQQAAFLEVEETAATQRRIMADEDDRDAARIKDGTKNMCPLETIVYRTGEIFAELGVKIIPSDTPMSYKTWELRILREDREIIYQKCHPLDRMNVVVKLHPNTSYFVQTRGGDSAWSPMGRIRTHAEISTTVQEVGEDFVRISWDRPVRDHTGLLPESLGPAGSQVIEAMEGYQIKILRESDMIQEYLEEFEPGTRTHTVYGLKPATRYIVMYSSLTLIRTRRQWAEVARIITQPSFMMFVEGRGEDAITVRWERGKEPTTGRPATTATTYITHESQLHKLEISLNETQVVEVSALSSQHTFCFLTGGQTYRIRMRPLTIQGRWGPWTIAPLIVTLPPPMRLDVVSIGQTYARIQCECNDPDLTRIDVSIVGVSHPFTFEGSNLSVIQDLRPGTQYKVFARAIFCDGKTNGLWSSAQEITTRTKCWVDVTERGEDFLTVKWSNPQSQNVIKVTQLSTGKEVLCQEVADGTSHRIKCLAAGETYTIQVKVFEEGFVWSTWSDPVEVATLKSVAMYIVDVGENFVHVAWSRAALGATSTWHDLKYEFVLGCIDTGIDAIVHREVLETSFVINSLVPNTTYVISVRACDEHEQWGLWCRATFRTLSSVSLLDHEIGEDYIRLMWQRERIVAGPIPDAQFVGNAYVSSCSLCVYSVDEGADYRAADEDYEVLEEDYEPSIGAEIRRIERFDSTHSSFRIAGLAADRQYRAVLRAATSTGKWGLWSQELLFRTVAPFRISTTNLSIGENYITMNWARDNHPLVPLHTRLGDYTVTSTQLRMSNLDTQSDLVENLDAEDRRKKLYGLTPATPYAVSVRACNSAGEWGTWSSPVNFVTRPTIVVRVVEIAEDYIILGWERRTNEIPPGFLTGREHIKSYHLKMTDKATYSRDEHLVDSQCPYTLQNLQPDSIYYAQIKANYGEEDWGLWSNPLVCLTLKRLVITPVTRNAISEKSIHIRWSRGNDSSSQRRLPGGMSDEKEAPLLCFGQQRPVYQLRVTVRQPISESLFTGNQLPPAVSDERVHIEPEITTESQDVKFHILDLKCGTVYGMKVRSKLEDGEWGMWSELLQLLTLPPIVCVFQSIGEDYLKVEWRREICNFGGIPSGTGQITRSELKIRDLNSAWVQNHAIDTAATIFTIDKLNPSATYAVSVRTFNGHDWGVMGEEARARTIPPLDVYIEKIGEDFVWLSWLRRPENNTDLTHDSHLITDATIRSFEVKIHGSSGSIYHKEISTNCAVIKGLAPDEIFDVRIRAMTKAGMWGQWAHMTFRTLPCLKVQFGNIGEHFAVLQWIRMAPSGPATPSNVKEGEDYIKRFKLKVQQVGKQATTYFLANSCTSFRLVDLVPSAEYRTWIAAQEIDGEWGLWSLEGRFRTLPSMSIKVTSVGEEYVTVSWKRDAWEGEVSPEPLGDDVIDAVPLHVVQGVVSEYQIVATNAEGTKTVAEAFLGTSASTFKLTGLSARSSFIIRVRTKDPYGERGLWSPEERFCTLFPVKMNVLRVGEEFAVLEWARWDILRSVEIERRQLELTTMAESMNSSQSSSTPEIPALDPDVDPTSFDGSNAPPVDPDEEDEVPIFPSSNARGNATVQKWVVRVYGNKLFGGVPAADNFFELEMPSEGATRIIPKLLPGTTYQVQLRAMDAQGEWGFWSLTSELTTMPVTTTTIHYIGEDFFSCSWQRPLPPEFPPHWTVYPSPLGEHNYDLVVTLVHDQEGLVQEPRQFRTTQNRLTVYDLLPGAYYKVVVREQLAADLLPSLSGSLDDWGTQSTPINIEMTPPLRISMKTIGESYANLSWSRRVSTTTYLYDAQRSTCIVTSYAVTVQTLDSKASNGIDYLSRKFDAATTVMNLPILLSNTIYSVRVQAITDGEHVGQWSPPTCFVTMKQLKILIEAINENNVILSWVRPQPDWFAKTNENLASSGRRDTAVDDAGRSLDGRSEMSQNSGDQALVEDAASLISIVGATGDDVVDMRHVQLGNYEAASYELEVDGLGHTFQQLLTLAGHSTTRLTELAAHSCYTCRVRSMGVDEIWSPLSQRVTFCTLRPLKIVFGKIAENFAWVRWERPFQNIDDFEEMLEKTRRAITNKREEHEAEVQAKKLKERFAKEQRKDAEEDAIGTGVSLLPEEEIVPTGHEPTIAELFDITYLLSEKVHFGKPESTSYHIRIYSKGGGHPIVRSPDGATEFERFEPVKVIQKPKLKDAKKDAKKMSRKEKIAEKNLEAEAEAAVAGTGSIETKRVVGFRGDVGEAEVDDGVMLLEQRFPQRTNEIRIAGLLPATEYLVCLRAQNSYAEWSTWTPKKAQVTLPRVSLLQAGFGEHYANLYWYRRSQEEITHEEEESRAISEWDNFEKNIKEDPRRMQEMSAVDKEKFIVDRRAIKQREKAIAELMETRREGGGTVACVNDTTCVGFLVRLIHAADNGVCEDVYCPEIAGDKITHSHTFAKLTENNLYMVLVSPDYGNGEWGAWSDPIQFMTQNLLQLSISYIGENFIQMDWKRAVNKKFKGDEYVNVYYNPIAQGFGHQYQVIVTLDKGKTQEFSVKDSNSFRLEDLNPDMQYSVKVREWDPKGEWGLWSPTRICVTLARTIVRTSEVGENWLQVDWRRSHNRNSVNVDDPNAVIMPIEVDGYYINVEEINEEVDGRQSPEHAIKPPSSEEDGSKDGELLNEQTLEMDTHEMEFADFMEKAIVETHEDWGQHRLPKERAAYDNTHGRYSLVKILDPDVTKFIIEDLHPSKFYCVRVMCRTKGGEVGLWSQEVYAVTMNAMTLNVDVVAETSICLSWGREKSRKSNMIEGFLHSNEWSLAEYHLEVESTNGFTFTGKFLPHETAFAVKDLSMNTVYTIKVRAKDMKDRWSVWSTSINVLTLKPVVVTPLRIAEQFAWVEWAREMQEPPEGQDVLITIEKPTTSHLRVYATGDPSNVPIVDREFQGAVSRYQITYLSPNTSYSVEARVKNHAGEWGVWSKKVISTMRHLQTYVTSRGEDFLKLQWCRDAPTPFEEESPSDNRANTSVVYTTEHTTILKYRVTLVRNVDTASGDSTITCDLENGATEVLIPGLKPDTSYTATVRAFHGEEDWGLWSQPVQTTTLNLHLLNCKLVGEDYLTAAWSRKPNTPNAHGIAATTTCFQVRVCDARKLEGLDEEIVLQDLFCVTNSTTVSDLLPNYRHRIMIRRWYVPSRSLTREELRNMEPWDEEAPPTGPCPNDPDAVAGAWTEAITVATVKPMVVVAEDISEDFFSVRWERDTTLPSYPARSVLRMTNTVQSYHVRIDELTADGASHNNVMSTLHIDQQFPAEEMAFRVSPLKSDTLYRIDVRALTDGVWGLWSPPKVVMTLPKISVSITYIGEDYVSLLWDRPIRQVTLPDGTQAVVGNNSNLSKYHLVMYGVNHAFRLDKKFKPNRTSYKVKRLDPNVVFIVTIRSADINNVWSAASENITFATLKPLMLQFGRVSENFAHVSWTRDPQSVDEYTSVSAVPPSLGDATVLKYHLCVFPADHGPTTAFVDRQLPGDVTVFPVSNLNPNTTYIFIVRACTADGVWGLWSEERTITTLPLLNVKLLSIGENYVAISWSRDDAPSTAQPSTLAVADVTAYHVFLTGDNGMEYDTVLPLADLQYEGTLPSIPVFVVRSLKPDNKYVVTLQASYGGQEWGLRTAPVAFATLNQLGLSVSNIGETCADFTWGRAPQVQTIEAGLKGQPVGRGEVAKYALHIGRTKRDTGPANVISMVTTLTTIGDETLPPADPVEVTTVPLPPPVDDFFVLEKEMERNQYSYIQTYCPVTSLIVNTEYMVRIRAMDDRKEWGEWTELVFETQPLPPGRAQLKKSGANSVTLSWDPPDHIYKYQYLIEQAVIKADAAAKKKSGVKEESGGAAEWKVVETTTECFTKQTTRVQINRLRFRVKCTKADAAVTLWSAWSLVAAFASSQPPEPVTGYKLVELSTTAATIEWQRSASLPGVGADTPTVLAPNYRVFFASKDAQPTFLTATKHATYTLSDLEPNTLYRFYVVVEAAEGGLQSVRNQVFKFATRPVERGNSLQTTDLTQTGLPPIPVKPGTPPQLELKRKSITTLPPAIADPTKGGEKRKSVAVVGGPVLDPKPPPNTPPTSKRPQPPANRAPPVTAPTSTAVAQPSPRGESGQLNELDSDDEGNL